MITNIKKQMRKYLFSALLALCSVQMATAQSGTNSPYSQFGLGELTNQGSGYNRAMSGLSMGLRQHNQVNYLNPASYSSIDSLTFIFDIGMSGQITSFKEGNVKKNANNADLEYIVGGFRLARHLGFGFGLLPYSNVGYNYMSTQEVNDKYSTTSTATYSGTGGVHQVFIGMGWEPFKGLSIGFNGGYLFGDYTKSVVNSYSDAYANSLAKTYTAHIHSYTLQGGLQYQAKLSKQDALTIGLSYTYGHKIGGDPSLQVISTNSQTSVSDTASFPTSGHYELAIPTKYAGGLAYTHGSQWTVGLDYELEKWSDVEYPVYVANTTNASTYVMSSNYFKDRQKWTGGVEFCPDERGRSLLKRIRYRAGFSYTTPYYYINGADGPKEMGASIGFGIPIMNGYNNRSFLNISGQWIHRSAENYITENVFRINIGLTFNERWFAKWKVE